VLDPAGWCAAPCKSYDFPLSLCVALGRRLRLFVASKGQEEGNVRRSAQALLTGLWESGTGCVRVQILQEFFVTVTKKVAEPLTVDEAKSRIREFAAWHVFSPSEEEALAGLTCIRTLESGSGTQCWSESGCETCGQTI
jgi:hypothetical protein